MLSFLYIYLQFFQDNGNKLPDKRDVIAAISKNAALKKEMKKVMPVIQMLSSEFDIIGEEIFVLELLFEEEAVINAFESYIKKFLDVKEIQIEKIEVDNPDLPNAAKASIPGKPSIEFM